MAECLSPITGEAPLRPSERDVRFADYLQGLADAGNAAALASFRRGLGKPPGAVPDMLRWLSPWTSASGLREASVYFQVASLFALYPCPGGAGGMGETCAQLRRCRPGKGLEGRFTRLLGARGGDLWRHPMGLVALAREAGVPVSWARLAADMRHWDHPRRYVQMDWAREFWGVGSGTERSDIHGLAPTRRLI